MSMVLVDILDRCWYWMLLGWCVGVGVLVCWCVLGCVLRVLVGL